MKYITTLLFDNQKKVGIISHAILYMTKATTREETSSIKQIWKIQA
jgi:hypothetical protein